MEGRSVDLLSADLYGDEAARVYRALRSESPVHRDEINDLWGIATYDGVLVAERDPGVFSSAGGTRPEAGPLPWMIDLDGVDHARRRKLVSRGFTPARVRERAARVQSICDDLVDEVCEEGACDLVRDLAAPLPMIVIGDMLGVLPEERGDLLRWSDDLIGALSGAPDRIEAAAEAFSAYDAYARRAIDARREHPTDDLVSVLVHADVDGEALTDDDIVFESLLILVGGDESTRHVISGGIEALLRHGDPAEVRADPTSVARAVEEMLRWVSPIKQMMRTVTRDTELLGTALRAGDRLVLLYESANFDEAHFADATRFDVRRSPNDHLAFGFGPHVCLGASLGRLEIQTMVRTILNRLPDLALADGAPPRFLGALQALTVTFTPSRRRSR